MGISTRFDLFFQIIHVTVLSVAHAALVLVHPDPAVIPDDGGMFKHLGLPLVIHRDPTAAIPDLISSPIAGALFAAQMDSELPSQICQIATGQHPRPPFPLFFWGPGGSAATIDVILGEGAYDCFPETMGAEEVTVRMGHLLRRVSTTPQDSNKENDDKGFHKKVRALAHDLKNPLCVLYGYAQMAQMGQPIEPHEAKDMVESAQEIRDQINTILRSNQAEDHSTLDSSPLVEARA